jgi:DNA-binding HxlR family transcriptional regulator
MDPAKDHVRAASLIRSLTDFGDWWTALILREAFFGVRHFAAFHSKLAIPRQTLTNRLREMVDNGIFYLKPYQTRPVRHEYRLTAKGLDLYGYALICWKWNRRWGDDRSAALPSRLVHRTCGQVFEPVFACGHCREEVELQSVTWADGPGQDGPAGPPPCRAKRLTVSREVIVGNNLYQHGAFVMTDRWSHAILVWAFRGHSSFDTFENELGIAASTLANRLRHLVDARLLYRLADPGDARRFHYRLTERGQDLFSISLMLAHWADCWMRQPTGSATAIRHDHGDHALIPAAYCSACRKDLSWRDVGFDWDQASALPP